MLKLYQIMVGFLKCKVQDRFGQSHKFTLLNPTFEQLLEGEEVYEGAYSDALEDGLFDDSQYLNYMNENELWTPDDEIYLGQIPREIDDLKLSMYENITRSNTREILRKKLKVKKDEYGALFAQKYKMNYLTADGVASMARSYFIAGACIKEGQIALDDSNYILDEILSFKNKNRISEEQFREIARSDTWRSYWSCGSPFKENLSEDQRTLISISKMYDNVRESPECPAEDVIKDDDMLDGWIIKQKRKREAQQAGNDITISDRLAGADMVFLPAETNDDLVRINSLNTPAAKMLKNQRIKEMNQKGIVHEQEFTDQRLKMFKK